jgi:putative ABC transport system substrate-binding protein
VLTSNNPTHPQQYELAQTATKALGLVAIHVPALTPSDLEPAFETMKQEHCDALFVLADATRPAIPTLAARSRLPAIYQSSPYMSLGGLASYHPQLEAIFRKVAHYVDRIFKGTDPAEYPVEQPVFFELAVNLKTAASLGVTSPASVLARADKVTE